MLIRNKDLHKIWRTLRKMSLSVCQKMVWLLISRPHLIYGTVYATIEVTLISEQKYTVSHSSNTIANGFKHATWNALIAYHTQWFYTSPISALAWAKRITDLHEDCFPNHSADKEMDLTNNEIGRQIYLKLYEKFEKKPNKTLLIDTIYNEENLVHLS